MVSLPPGIHDGIPAEQYHADPCPEPSLSAGIAQRLISQSPLHAYTHHPRLNPAYQDEHADRMDFGSAAHALLLDGLDICQVIDGFDDWKKQAARDYRDEARTAGLIPLLRKDYERMCELCEAVKRQIGRLDVHPLPLRDGKPEQTLIWQEDDVWCRGRLDWLHESGEHVDDLKTTAMSASPYVWARNRLFADGKDIQAVHYLAGLRAVTGTDAVWRFVVVEVGPPYALSVISLAPSALELAKAKRARALKLWKRCLTDGSWPGYPGEVAYAEVPGWEEQRFLEAHWEEEAAAA